MKLADLRLPGDVEKATAVPFAPPSVSIRGPSSDMGQIIGESKTQSDNPIALEQC